MYVWKLWNLSNYSTAYVVAESREKAKCIRPDGAKWDRVRGWRLPMTWRGRGFQATHVETPTPQTLEGWPDHPDDVRADRFARVERPFGADDGVLGTNIDTDLRPPEDAQLLKEIG